MTQRLPFLDRLAVPAIAAPMLRVSGIELVSAACRAGVVGAFPTANAESLEAFAGWMARLNDEAAAARDAGTAHAPWCPNLIMRRDPARVAEPVTAIALAAGFVNLSHFSRVFRAHTGLSPSDFRRQALG